VWFPLLILIAPAIETYIFDRALARLTFIQKRLLGKAQLTEYKLQDISEIQITEVSTEQGITSRSRSNSTPITKNIYSVNSVTNKTHKKRSRNYKTFYRRHHKKQKSRAND
jgi:hypothetical protein